MGKYVYRVMNELEEASNLILSKDYFDYSPYILIPKLDNLFGRDALDNIASHLTKGNTVHTPWISCSKEIEILRSFATEQTDIRPLFALIKEHSKTTLESEKIKEHIAALQNKEITYETFRKRVRYMHFNDLKKVVLDFSKNRDILYEMFIKFGMVNKKTGDVRYKDFTREINYARINKELLILGEVPSSDVTIFSPLQYDVLYALKQNESIKEIEENIVNIIKQDLSVRSFVPIVEPKIEDYLYGYTKELYILLTEEEKFIFKKLYIERFPIYNYLNDELKKLCLSIQRKILEKAISLMNEKRLLGLNTNNIRTIQEDKRLTKVS